MKKKENEVSSDALAKKGACKLGIEEFKKWYPSGSATLTEVLRKLQELASTSADYDEYEIYIEYAIWLFDNFPPTQETLVLNELTEKVIIHNGDVTIKKGVKGERFIINNGDLNIEGGANLSGAAEIWAENVKAKDITLFDDAEIWANKTIDATNIAAKDCSEIWAKKINAQNIMDDDGAIIYGDINIIQPSSN